MSREELLINYWKAKARELEDSVLELQVQLLELTQPKVEESVDESTS